MKILVLGGSSSIGSEFIKNVPRKHEVFSTYNKSNLVLETTQIKFCYPNDFMEIKKKILMKKPDVIINFIGYTNLDFCENNKDEAYKLNVELPKKFLEISSEINSKFIQFSTDYVFDGKTGNYKENDEKNPTNYYGYTKHISEIETLQNSNNIVIRTSSVYDLKYRTNFLKFVFQKLMDDKKCDAFTDVYSTPILVDDLVRITIDIIEKNERGIFHISGNECISRFEFAKKIAKIIGFNEKLVFPISQKMAKQKIFRPKDSCLNNDKIKDVIKAKFSSIDENMEKIKVNLQQDC